MSLWGCDADPRQFTVRSTEVRSTEVRSTEVINMIYHIVWYNGPYDMWYNSTKMVQDQSAT